jgi:iron complex outermembrane receptor protein
MRKTRPTILSIAIASLFAATPLLAQQKEEEAKKVETISIIGEGDKLGTGLIIQEEAPKARSTSSAPPRTRTRGCSSCRA